MNNHPTPLVLASASPRRLQLLTQIGVQCDVLPQNIDETPLPDENPSDYVTRLARGKAEAALRCAGPERTVLGSDTIVCCEGSILGKPRDRAHALSMLDFLSGKTHEVRTAVHLMRSSLEAGRFSISRVKFRKIEREEAERYWLTGEPVGKAGAYGIQGNAAVFVESIEGSYSGVMGLPLFETAELLQEFNIPCWQPMEDYV